jgi:hypothetical protein
MRAYRIVKARHALDAITTTSQRRSLTASTIASQGSFENEDIASHSTPALRASTSTRIAADAFFATSRNPPAIPARGK